LDNYELLKAFSLTQSLRVRQKLIGLVRPAKPSTEANHILWIFAGLVVGIIWTSVGVGIAFLQGDSVRSFLREWTNYQGPFLLALGTWLLLIVRSRIFEERIAALTETGSVQAEIIGRRWMQILIVSFVTIVGAVTVSHMGFNGRGLVLAFMLLTNFCIDIASAIVTLHALKVVDVIHNLQYRLIKLSRYAPARTPELRGVVNYFSTFTLLLTVGYAFALVGTLKGDWTGSKDYVNAIQLFWPIIYVPICCAVLIYPHLAIHKLIQRQKGETLKSCQQDIDKLLSQYPELENEDIGRTNELAQLFDRITATPDYVIDFGIAVRTVLPLAFNLLTLFVKVSVGK